MSYDSTQDTLTHIENVRAFLGAIVASLEARAKTHDESKFQEPEKSSFDIFTPRLKGLTYGSEEYRACLREMKPAIEHHYSKNGHHPEHWPNGINDMSLLDVIEMLADWKAATLRHADGNLSQSLDVNRKRFEMSDQLAQIFQNTINELDW